MKTNYVMENLEIIEDDGVRKVYDKNTNEIFVITAYSQWIGDGWYSDRFCPEIVFYILEHGKYEKLEINSKHKKEIRNILKEQKMLFLDGYPDVIELNRIKKDSHFVMNRAPANGSVDGDEYISIADLQIINDDGVEKVIDNLDNEYILNGSFCGLNKTDTIFINEDIYFPKLILYILQYDEHKYICGHRREVKNILKKYGKKVLLKDIPDFIHVRKVPR